MTSRIALRPSPFVYPLVISFLPESLGSPGIVLVPAILFHFFQLLSCSFITVRWTPKEEEVEGGEEMEEMEVKDIQNEIQHPELMIEEKLPDVHVEMAVIPVNSTDVTNDCY